MKLITVTCSKRPEMWNNVFQNIVKQTRTPDGVVFVYHKTESDPTRLLRDLGECMSKPVIQLRVPDCISLPDVYHRAYDAAAHLGGKGSVLCTMDDDDNYGPEYLQEVEEMFLWHPDAALVGKSRYRVRYVDGRFPDEMDGRADVEADGEAVTVAGPTMCLSASLWLENQDYRLSEDASWADVDIQDRARKIGKIYSSSSDNFVLQRYPASHGHGWNRPDPKG